MSKGGACASGTWSKQIVSPSTKQVFAKLICSKMQCMSRARTDHNRIDATPQISMRLKTMFHHFSMLSSSCCHGFTRTTWSGFCDDLRTGLGSANLLLKPCHTYTIQFAPKDTLPLCYRQDTWRNARQCQLTLLLSHSVPLWNWCPATRNRTHLPW